MYFDVSDMVTDVMYHCCVPSVRMMGRGVLVGVGGIFVGVLVGVLVGGIGVKVEDEVGGCVGMDVGPPMVVQAEAMDSATNKMRKVRTGFMDAP